MPCYPLTQGKRITGFICCFDDFFRLPLADGRHVFMDWHHYLGPTFYRDRAMRRPWEDWWDNPLICAALDWFQGRGNRA